MSINRWTSSVILALALTMCGSPTGSEGSGPSPEDPLHHGVVFDTEGHRIAGAKVYWFARGMLEDRVPEAPIATTDDHGEFRFRAAVPPPDKDLPDADEFFGSDAPGLMAIADGFGIGFEPAVRKGEMGIVLVKDDVPMTGRLLNPNGRPVVGARVWGIMVLVPGSGEGRLFGGSWPSTNEVPTTLDPWLNALKAAEDYRSSREANKLMTAIPPRRVDIFYGVHPPAVTGEDGRFRIDGIGRDRVLMAFIEGPGIESRVVFLATKAVEKPGVEPIWRQTRRTFDRDNLDLVYGPGFDHVVLPGRAIEGTVSDKDTRRPMPGVQVLCTRQTDLESRFTNRSGGFFWTKTDDDGHYKIDGFPVGPTYSLATRTEPDVPYPALSREVQVGLGDGPATLDFTLKRGVWLTGRVLDRATGQPQRHVQVEVYLEPSNPNIPEKPDQVSFDEQQTGEDGRFRIVTLPGPACSPAGTTTNPSREWAPIWSRPRRRKDTFKPIRKDSAPIM